MRRFSFHLQRLTRWFVLSASLLLVGAVAHADPPGPNALAIHVISVQSDDAEDQADALTGALRSRVRALHGFSLGEGDFALEVLTLGFKCGETPDEACQAKIADHIHADRYVWGTLKRIKANKQVVADLHFWVRSHPTSRTQFTYSDGLTAPGDEALKRLADDALTKLLGVHKAPPAAPSTGPTAVPAPAQSGAAGVARAPAASAAPAKSSSMTLSTGSTAELGEGRGNGHRTAGWAGVGLGGALIAAGVYSAVRVHDVDTNAEFQLYRAGFRPGVDVCDQARAGVDAKIVGAATPAEAQDFCSQATTFQTLQFVFFGLGAVSAGAGIYLLATDKSGVPAGPQTSWTLAPSVSRSSGRLQLRVAF
jgi:hypothetical protein